MDLRFIMVWKAVVVTAPLALPILLTGCGSLGVGATTASDLPPEKPDPPVASLEASVSRKEPASQQLNANVAPVIQGPTQVELVSFKATESVVKKNTEHRSDAKNRTTPRRVEHVNDRSFEQKVLDSDEAVLVDFYADWCGPCKKLSPVLDELAQETPDVRIVKVDIDRSPEAAKSYRVNSIPALILFKDGKPIARRGGLVSKDSLKELISQP
jgi:thioredoxin 1